MKKLFGADGIRGTIGKYPLRLEDVERLGRAIAAEVRAFSRVPEFLVGSDTRESSQRLKHALNEGLSRAGVRVVDAGILSTAALSFLIASKGFFSGGAMITASHNPVTENGIKVFDSSGVKIADEIEISIEGHFLGVRPLPFESYPALSRYEPLYAEHYARALVQEQWDEPRFKKRVLLDCANGAAYRLVPSVLGKLKLSYALINATPDGTNINHQSGSEYVRLAPKLFYKELRRWDADLGIAFDGDADRVVFIDRHGCFYNGDMILAMLSLRFHRLQKLSQQTVVITPLSNQGLIDYFKQHQIQTLEVRNGDKYITQALLTRNLTLGGEEIGHIILHTNNNRVTGDGLRTALFVLAELASHPDAVIRDLAPGMHRCSQIKASVFLGHRVTHKVAVIPGLSELIQELEGVVPDLNRLECRPASTEPVYRIILEARMTSVVALAQHASRLATYIQQFFNCPDERVQIIDCVNGGCL